MEEPSSSTHPSSPRPSRPSSPANPPQNDDNENDADESTPLLPSSDVNTAANRLTSVKLINLLTPLALSLAASTVILLLIITILTVTILYGDRMPWMTYQAMQGVVWPVHNTKSHL